MPPGIEQPNRFEIFSVHGGDVRKSTWVVDFLLPNGVMVTLEIDKECQLALIKDEVWKKAQDYPLHARLRGKGNYQFSYINPMAERCELDDESARLCDLGLFQPVLKLQEKKKSNDETNLKAVISTLIGKGLHEFDSMQSIEVSNFRDEKRKMCERIARDRDAQSWIHRVLCLYPGNIAPDSDLPKYLYSKLKDQKIQVRVSPDKMGTRWFTFSIDYDTKPSFLVTSVLKKLHNTIGKTSDAPEDFCLKVVGREEFLLDEHPLHQYNYIRTILASDEIPRLLLLKRSSILAEGEPPKPPSRKLIEGNKQLPHSEPNRRKTSLWDLDMDEKFEIVLRGVANVNLPDQKSIQIRAALYHGLEIMGEVLNSGDQQIKEGCTEWNEKMTFKISLPDVPRMARLCFLIYEIKKDKKQTKEKKGGEKGNALKIIKEGRYEIRPVAWVNIPVFGFQGVLRVGPQTLYMWSLTDDDCLFDSALNPIGTVECNPDVDDAVQIRFDFSNHNVDGDITFPSMETVLQVAAENTRPLQPIPNVSVGKTATKRGTITSALFTITDAMKEQLRLHIDKDPLHELTDQDKEIIWKLRLECHEYFSHSLPKVLSCVFWEKHINVALMQALLQIWRLLPGEVALELLDFRYPDKEVRKFAVRCLRQLTDQELCEYLLQLVQVLKYEQYLDCDLVNFLLERALNNQHIGHNLFWLLKSEMHVSSVSVRFGLILEAYCMGNKNHLKALSRQVEALKKLRHLNDGIKHMGNVEKISKDQVVNEMRKLLGKKLFQESLANLHCFLDPARILKSAKADSCKVMDSKMKPMWLTWCNQDNNVELVNILYKRGDDLRQDMLTLQILKIMDNIWLKEGMDLRINAYRCVSTGQMEGMIGIVTQAETIAQIQRQYSQGFSAAFNKACLFNWIKKKNTDPESLDKAFNEFLLSCAGQCVATYVLGIGDRHSDNILLRENGQLVHIDFGHILGHFKSKMGFKRERVPFVLTADFIYIIQKGPKKENEMLKKFEKLCEKAYMTLRMHSHFLITLFMMMINTGIPELSSVRDVEFLRQTLVPHYTDAEAIKHWQSKYSEALKNSFWANVNFAFHNAVRDNK